MDFWKLHILNIKVIIQIWFYIYNLDTDVLIKHLLLHERAFWGKLIASVTGKTYRSVIVFTYVSRKESHR